MRHGFRPSRAAAAAVVGLVLSCLIRVDVSSAQSLSSKIVGTVEDGQGVDVREPVLVQLTEAVTDSVIAAGWSDANGYFELVYRGRARATFRATRYGTAAVYRVQTLVELPAGEDLLFRIVLPEPAEAAIVKPSATYHDKNRALTEGMLLGASVQVTGQSRHTAFDALPPVAAMRIMTTEAPYERLDVRLSPLGVDQQPVLTGGYQQVCFSGHVCFLEAMPGTYELAITTLPGQDDQRYRVTLDSGLTTVNVK